MGDEDDWGDGVVTWERALAGDQEARAELSEGLAAFARRWLPSRVPSQEMDNVLQEAQLRMLEHLDEKKHVRHVGGYFKTRCLGAYTEWLRTRRRGEAFSGDIPLDPVDERFRPADGALLEELRKAIAECRNRLKDELARTWRLRYESEQSPRHIAQELSISYNTVVWRIHEARKAIWACLLLKRALPEA